jgi:hypothetical protein
MFLLFCLPIKIFQKGNRIKIAGRRVFGISKEFFFLEEKGIRVSPAIFSRGE